MGLAVSPTLLKTLVAAVHELACGTSRHFNAFGRFRSEADVNRAALTEIVSTCPSVMGSRLRSEPEIGDGVVARVCARVQQDLRKVPALNGRPGGK